MSVEFLYEPHVIEIDGIAPGNGPTAGGIPVQVLGRGFAGLTSAADPAVTFDGLPAGITEWGDSYIQCTAPAHTPGSVDVTVTNADGESATYTLAFAYGDAAPPPLDLRFRTPSGGVSRLSRVENPPPRIVQTIGQPAQATFSSPLEPNGLDAVTWTCFGQVLFDGIIVRAGARTEGAVKLEVWDCACLDYAHLLAKAYPLGEWESTSATTILTTLLAQYAPGFTLIVEGGLPPITLQLDGGQDLWSVIVSVCELAGAHPLLVSTTLRVFTADAAYDSPAPVTDGNPDLLWPEQGQAVVLDNDYSQLANSVTVYGAEGISALREEPASIAKYGRCPLPIFDNTLTTYDECARRAQAAINAHAWPVPTATYATRDLKTMAGKTVSINVSAPAIDDVFLIQNVTIDQLELLAVGERPRFLVTAVPPWAPAERRADPTARILQDAVDVAAAEDKQPRLDGDVTSSPGGRTTIPAGSVSATKLAGCIGSDLLTPTDVVAGDYGGDLGTARTAAPRSFTPNSRIVAFRVDAAGRITAAAEDAVQAIKADGAVPFTADQPVGGHKLTDVAAPTAPADAATKSYVDGAIAAIPPATGAVLADGSVPFAADESMGGHKLTDVAAPTAGTDATNKTYVDAAVAGGGGGGGGIVKQIVTTQTGAVATGSTIIPFDDTVPQNTEGTQFMSLAITPLNAANVLDIEVIVWATVTATPWIIVALFQDTIANALAVVATFNNLSTAGATIPLRFSMVAGSTSPITFKVRVGPSGAATLTFNGQSAGRIFGGVAASSIRITERAP